MISKRELNKAKILTPKQLRRRELYQQNKEHEKAVNDKWKNENHERLQRYKERYRKENKEYRSQWNKDYFIRNREELLKKGRQYYREQHEQILARTRVRLRRVKQEVITEYGGCCTCCGETLLEFLCLDHIFNDGKQHRKELKHKVGSAFYRYLRAHRFPFKDRLQVHCYNCNGAKAYYGVCPHQEDKNASSPI
jgi:hypothetical protein